MLDLKKLKNKLIFYTFLSLVSLIISLSVYVLYLREQIIFEEGQVFVLQADNKKLKDAVRKKDIQVDLMLCVFHRVNDELDGIVQYYLPEELQHIIVTKKKQIKEVDDEQ